MEVYLIRFYDGDEYAFIGICSTKENADKVITEDLKKPCNKFFSKEDYLVTPVILDKLMH